jgi:hypothetical protein
VRQAHHISQDLPRNRRYRAPMYGATASFGHATALDAVKSVSFEIKKSVSDLKIVLKQC